MVRILFTDPTETYQHNDEELVEGIRTLIRKARSSISIHGLQPERISRERLV